eukprot:scaffold45777_cov75-Phaeocystis_antarctica.AAC.2
MTSLSCATQAVTRRTSRASSVSARGAPLGSPGCPSGAGCHKAHKPCFLCERASGEARVYAWYRPRSRGAGVVRGSRTSEGPRRDRQRTCAGRALNCGIVEATTGKTRGHQVPKRPKPPTKLNTTKGGMDSVLKSSMSPNLNARGLGLGETPLRRWGGYRGLFIVSVDHCASPT